MTQYKPGTCNIGAEEKKARMLIGTIFAVVSVALIIYLQGSPRFAWVFVPLFISALGFIQARQNFCVAYGLAGKYSMSEFGHAKRVANKEARNKDVNHSLVLIFFSAVIAAGLTLAAMAL